MTPPDVAERAVAYFKPRGRVLEPCAGTGVIAAALRKKCRNVLTCEINEGSNFFDFKDKVDWVFTNPPWSQIRPFMEHASKLSDHVVFLMTVNHAFLTARWRIMDAQHFQMSEIVLINWPKEFKKSGFLLGWVHWQRRIAKKPSPTNVLITDWRKPGS